MELISEDRRVTYENITYGMMVEVIHEAGGYHSGCKVHFFNRKGVLVGNFYEFMPYDRLRKRVAFAVNRDYQRFFYGKRLERIKQAMFIQFLRLTSFLIRQTQRHMD